MSKEETYEKEVIDSILEKVAQFIGETLSIIETLDCEKKNLEKKIAEISNEKVKLEKVASDVKPQLVDTLLDRMVDLKILPSGERQEAREKLAEDRNNIVRLAINLTKQIDADYTIGQGVLKESSTISDDSDPDGWEEVANGRV